MGMSEGDFKLVLEVLKTLQRIELLLLQSAQRQEAKDNPRLGTSGGPDFGDIP